MPSVVSSFEIDSWVILWLVLVVVLAPVVAPNCISSLVLVAHVLVLVAHVLVLMAHAMVVTHKTVAHLMVAQIIVLVLLDMWFSGLVDTGLLYFCVFCLECCFTCHVFFISLLFISWLTGLD